MFEYLPLKAGELIGRLSFSSSELGVYQYDLNLTATPAGYYIDPIQECIFTHNTVHLLCGQSLF